MKRSLWSFTLALLAVASFACSDGSGTSYTDNPVAPTSADLTSVVGAVQAQAQICHWNPDYLLDGDPYEYHVIAVSTNGNALNAHSAHGDPACDVSALAVGDDCEATCVPSVPSSVTAWVQAGKTLICHNDVDDEDPWDSIAIEVSGNSAGKHIANHGDCYTTDPVDTQNCSCITV